MRNPKAYFIVFGAVLFLASANVFAEPGGDHGAPPFDFDSAPPPPPPEDTKEEKALKRPLADNESELTKWLEENLAVDGQPVLKQIKAGLAQAFKAAGDAESERQKAKILGEAIEAAEDVLWTKHKAAGKKSPLALDLNLHRKWLRALARTYPEGGLLRKALEVKESENANVSGDAKGIGEHWQDSERDPGNKEFLRALIEQELPRRRGQGVELVKRSANQFPSLLIPLMGAGGEHTIAVAISHPDEPKNEPTEEPYTVSVPE